MVTLYLANNIDRTVHTVSAEPLGDGTYKVKPNAVVQLATPIATGPMLLSFHATLEEAAAYVEAYFAESVIL